MARRRWYRRSVRVVAAKKKWASHFSSGTLGFTGNVLVENSSQTASPTPVILKTGNFKVQGDVSISNTGSGSGLVRLVIFVSFVPEGYSGGASDILGQHPEWIMGWTAVDTSGAGTGSTTNGSKWSITSRLKRNLNSGDRIKLFYDSTGASATTYNMNFNAQYWTCSN